MLIYLYIKTKNYHFLKKIPKIFLRVLFKNKIRKFKYYPLVKKRTLFSLLKSPHVNKTAQEQYEFKKSHRKIIIQTKYDLKSIVIFKKLYHKIFSSELNIKLSISKLPEKKSISLLKKTYPLKTKLKLLDLIGDRKLKLRIKITFK